MVRTFEQGLQAIKEKVALIPADKRRQVYFEAIHRKMKTFAPASLTMFALSSAGGVNVAADADQVRDTNIAEYGKERILARAHEIDLFLAQVGVMNKVDRRQILAEPGFSVIKAVREGQVYTVDEKLVSRPTMRLLQGIQGLAEILYPELF
jgi:iron complex transport system substrate-binding protein